MVWGYDLVFWDEHLLSGRDLLSGLLRLIRCPNILLHDAIPVESYHTHVKIFPISHLVNSRGNLYLKRGLPILVCRSWLWKTELLEWWLLYWHHVGTSHCVILLKQAPHDTLNFTIFLFGRDLVYLILVGDCNGWCDFNWMSKGHWISWLFLNVVIEHAWLSYRLILNLFIFFLLLFPFFFLFQLAIDRFKFLL